MSYVFVLDSTRQPLNPVHPGRARLLLTSGKAAVFKRSPFTIVLKESVEHPQLYPLRLKLDPGSKTTGIALLNDQSGQVLFAAELVHRGQAIKEAPTLVEACDGRAEGGTPGTGKHASAIAAEPRAGSHHRCGVASAM